MIKLSLRLWPEWCGAPTNRVTVWGVVAGTAALDL